ncbi:MULTISPECIES: hypothetical protein [Cupriavidus]|uniref:Uncharacterized protein n=2 Tax=Cupriavidus TaxID=106589 RepID=A0A375HUD0_9BURK|nr:MULTISPECIES: hypothetical protein [Cupriavidus]ULX55914.1 hypothetical protein A9P79_28345 [Cupriavidus taiwanensis]SPD37533.1 protein of unknown function [Cupriavidus taiwanensis]SPD61841.1 protein of unknown function [Cupriavidus taiwanensis]SPD62504.1 protein of unknown function [Cupriavidus neocaledonicus]SPD69623.1 protein of unknown function [Cupriavidus taiwanensis]
MTATVKSVMSSTPVTITAAELQLLRNAAKERDALKGELRVVTVERDLLLERLNRPLKYLQRTSARRLAEALL